jgi:hypothetical protein
MGARHRDGRRSRPGGEGRSADGGQRTGRGINRVPGNIAAHPTRVRGARIRHIGELACGATDTGLKSAAKGDPLMGVSAPVVGLIVYPDTLLEKLFAT